jgi:hypothetical protein
MKPSFKDYIFAAFNARPWGMPLPPNWAMIAGFGLLGFLEPGLWIVGAGVELLYLFTLATSSRFQRWVTGRKLASSVKDWQTQLNQELSKLNSADRRNYEALAIRARAILQQQGGDPASLKAQAEGLSRLMWIYLRLLMTKRRIEGVIEEAMTAPGETLPELERKLELQMASPKITDDVRKSLSGQLEIVRQRLRSQREAREKLAFLNAELSRVQQQVELIREQAVLTTDPATVSQNIDQISATLSGTTEWIQEQQKIYGSMEDLLTEPPPIMMEVVVERR